jgi:protein-disulfide isomerase-like protein with CxxC motif
MNLKGTIDMNFSLRMALPIAAAMLLSPLASAQTMSPQTTPAQSPAAVTPPAQTFSTDQRHEIEGIVKDYLVQHPEVLQDAMDALDKQQKQADADKARVTIKDNNAAIFNSPHQDPTGKKYIEFHQKLLGGRGAADKERALAVAKEVGFDMARLEKDMDSDEVKQTIDEDMKLADALGVNGTPSYVVGDEVVVGAVGIDTLKDKIKAQQK